MKFLALNLFSLVLISSLLIVGCGVEESRPTYKSLDNVIVTKTSKIGWSEETGLENIGKVERELTNKERELFSVSLEWIGTESSIPLSKLSGMSAHEVVDLANCLKENLETNYDTCF